MCGHDDGVLLAWPHIVAQDADELTALYIPEGTRRSQVDPLDPARPLADEVWRRFNTLRLMFPGRAHSVWLFWDAGSHDFLRWYVNLEAPFRRHELGFDTTDNALDITVSRDLRWRCKDEDELAGAVRLGIYSREQAAAIRAEGERVIEAIEARRPPFDGRWEGWRPDPAWGIATAPAGWERVPGIDST